MKTLLLGLSAALLASGCATISTELDPEGSRKYRAANSTGTNIARRFSARDMPNTKELGADEIDRMLRQGKNPGKPPS